MTIDVSYSTSSHKVENNDYIVKLSAAGVDTLLDEGRYTEVIQNPQQFEAAFLKLFMEVKETNNFKIESNESEVSISWDKHTLQVLGSALRVYRNGIALALSQGKNEAIFSVE